MIRRCLALHRSTRIAAAVGALLALLTLGPMALAVVMVRCCAAAPGPDAGAYAVVAGLVAVAMSLAALASGTLASVVRRLVS